LADFCVEAAESDQFGIGSTRQRRSGTELFDDWHVDEVPRVLS
jgi:hypothetical protein